LRVEGVSKSFDVADAFWTTEYASLFVNVAGDRDSFNGSKDEGICRLKRKEQDVNVKEDLWMYWLPPMVSLEINS